MPQAEDCSLFFILRNAETSLGTNGVWGTTQIIAIIVNYERWTVQDRKLVQMRKQKSFSVIVQNKNKVTCNISHKTSVLKFKIIIETYDVKYVKL